MCVSGLFTISGRRSSPADDALDNGPSRQFPSPDLSHEVHRDRNIPVFLKKTIKMP